MPRYRYTAVTSALEERAGEILSEGVNEAFAALLNQGLTPVSVRPEAAVDRLWRVLQSDVTAKRGLSSAYIENFCGKLAALVGAEVPLLDALILASEPGRERGQNRKRVVLFAEHIVSRVSAGASLSEALKERQYDVGPRFAAAVGAGEASGKLEFVLKSLAAQMKNTNAAKSKIVKALIYPCVLALASLSAIGVLMFLVVPLIGNLLSAEELARAPLTTRILMSVSAAFISNSAPITIMTTLFAAILFMLLLFPSANKKLQSWAFLIGFVREREMARYMSDLGIMLTAAVNLDASLRILTEGAGNIELQKRSRSVNELVSRGIALSVAMSDQGLLDREGITLLRIGERSGQLGLRVADVGAFLTNQSEARLQAFSSAAGPVLTLCFGLVCGLTAAALLSTILSLNDLAAV